MDDEGELSAQQEEALEWLTAGYGDQETGALVGVSRTTVWRWRRHHLVFRRELERHREARRAAIAQQVERADQRAMELVWDAISLGDLSTALIYLRIRGAAALALGESPEDEGDDLLDQMVTAIKAVVPADQWGKIADRIASLAEQG